MATTPRLLTVSTRKIHAGDPLLDQQLLDLLPGDAPLSWVCRDEGLVGWGMAARLDTTGPERFTEADGWWHELCERMRIDDEVQLPGTGPVAFASLAFADRPGGSALVVPQVVLGQRNGVRWITTITDADAETAEPGPDLLRTPEPIRPPGTIRYSDGQLSATGYREAVARAVRRMHGPDGIQKVVLAHDLLASTSEPLDSRFLLQNLAHRYPSCWTFAVDGLVGATPELLLERTGNQVHSRVLAGTAWPHEGIAADELAAELLSSSKNRGEHAYAVESVATQLRPFCDRLTVPDQPEVLRLRNVMHLASNVSGMLDEHSASDGTASLLRLADSVHPTAAVGGTPTNDAVRMIGEVERMDRERYTGPVGWIDADGNGEFGLALRCAQIHHAASLSGGSQLRLFAGGGIVADSDPDLEVAEAEAKFVPIREALEAVE